MELFLAALAGLIALAAVVMVVLLLKDKLRLTAELATLGGEVDRACEAEAQANQRTEAARSELRDAAAAFERIREQLTERTSQTDRLVGELEKTKAVFAEQQAASERIMAEREKTLRDQLAKLDQQSRERFESLASQTLKNASDEFMKRAEQSFKAQHDKHSTEIDQRRKSIDDLLKPMGETLGQTREHLLKLDERIAQSATTSKELRDETAKLARALSRPEVRGRYGEIQLRRVAELAGLTAYCDFSEQVSDRDESGLLQRPDMIVRLPNERMIVVDAKCNIDSYMQAINAPTPEAQEELMNRFARHVADQAKALGGKKYWSNFSGSPEFVVMFVPGDHFIDAALSRRPDLLDHAASTGVILASPSTLIGLLRAVHVGWREQRLAEEAHALLEAGKELHRRAATAFEHVNKLGSALNNAVGHFNKFVGSTDRMLMPHLRKFEEMDMQSKKLLESAPPIEQTAREMETVDVIVKPKALEAGKG